MANHGLDRPTILVMLPDAAAASAAPGRVNECEFRFIDCLR